MPVGVETQVIGLKEALRDLNKVDKLLANQIKKEARQVLAPVVNEAKANVPTEALSGMSRNWKGKQSGAKIFPWDGSIGRKYIKAKTSTKRPYERNGVVRDLAVFYVSWSGGANMVFDMAGRRNASAFADSLTMKFGPPSRIMWPAMEKHQDAVQDGIGKVVDKIVEETNRQLGRRIR